MKYLSHLFPFLIFKIVGNSMYPKFSSNDRLIVWRWFTSLSIGNVVVFSSPKIKKLLIKRIEKISQDMYFLVGDNKNESTDSRDFGWVDKKWIVGKVIFPKG